MRALFDARPGDASRTGIGRYTRTVARLLTTHPNEHEVIALGRDAAVPFHPRTPLEEELELPWVLEREGFDLYHSPLFHLPAVLPCRAVVTIHDAIPAVRPDLTSPGFARLFEEAADSAARAAAVVCPTESAKADVERHLGVPGKKIFVVTESPDPVFRPASVEERARVRREHGIGGGRFVLVLGSLERRKNPTCVLDALRAMGREAPSAVFVGPEAGFDLAREARARGIGALGLGALPDADLVALLSEAFALVFPSLYEGFGLPIVEAFACDTPVIASNAASIPEVAGDAALLFDPDEPAALVARLRELLASPELHRELVTKGRARLEHFTEDRVRAGFQNLYTNLGTRREGDSQ